MQFEFPGEKIIKIDWPHILGGTTDYGRFSGFHLDTNGKIRQSGLIKVQKGWERPQDKLINIRWKIATKAFENCNSKRSTIFEGSLEEFASLIQKGIHQLISNWDIKVTPFIKDGIVTTTTVYLKDGVKIGFTNLNLINYTIANIYPIITKPEKSIMQS